MLLAGMLFLAGVVVVGAQDRVSARGCYHHQSLGEDIYGFQHTDLHETRNISLADYSGKTHQYLELNVLQESFQNFEVLAFPCNQFGEKEPADNAEELLNGIKYVRPGNGYEPNFTMFKKTEINGENEHPLFTFLKSYCPPTRQSFADPKNLDYQPLLPNDIRGPWVKFLVNKKGKPFMRYDARTLPMDMKNDIYFLLQQEDLPKE